MLIVSLLRKDLGRSNINHTLHRVGTKLKNARYAARSIHSNRRLSVAFDDRRDKAPPSPRSVQDAVSTHKTSPIDTNELPSTGTLLS